MLKFLDMILIVPSGYIVLTTLHSLCANLTICSIIKQVLKYQETNKLFPPIFTWNIISTLLAIYISMAFLVYQLSQVEHELTVIANGVSFILYSIGYGFCSFVFGVVTNTIVQQTYTFKNIEEIKIALALYDKLVNNSGPHLMITLSTSTLKLILFIFETVNVIQCEGLALISLAISYVCLVLIDIHIIMYYCLTAHNCQSKFKDIATELRLLIFIGQLNS